MLASFIRRALGCVPMSQRPVSNVNNQKAASGILLTLEKPIRRCA
jgi:hypothetical protein